MTEDPNCIAHSVQFGFDSFVKLLLLPTLCLMSVAAYQIMNLTLSGKMVLYEQFVSFEPVGSKLRLQE